MDHQPGSHEHIGEKQNKTKYEGDEAMDVGRKIFGEKTRELLEQQKSLLPPLQNNSRFIF